MKLSTRHQSFFIPTIAFSLLNEGNEVLLYVYIYRGLWIVYRPESKLMLELTVDNRAFMVKTENRKREVEES